MNASITIPAYKPDKKILNKLISSIKTQKLDGKLEIILVDRREGFARQMNYGINKSKYDIVIMLPQDCIPKGKNWAKNLIEPFKDKKIIAAVSQIEFPDKLWDSMSLLGKALLIKEKGTITSLLDGKGGAYRKSTMKKIGLFDEKNFRTAGEDFDTYMKIRNLGKIAYPDATIIHMHPTSFKDRLRKNRQYANGYGALVRIYGADMHHWYIGIINALPILGIFSVIASYPFKKGLGLFLPFCLASIINHPYYIYGFWKGFIMKRQTI